MNALDSVESGSGCAAQLACPSCGCVKLTVIGRIPGSDVFAGRQLAQPLEGGSLYRCRKCHLSFRSPTRTEPELNALYRDGSQEAWVSNAARRRDWRIASAWIRDVLPKGSSILDVGCFDGAFLETLGPAYRWFGIEIQKDAREKACARGVDIIASNHDELAGLPGEFDGIVAFDLIEHVHNPTMFLSTLSKATRRSGVVIVSSGNSDAWTWRVMGSSYWYCAIGEHICFINPRWCEIVAPRVGLHMEGQARFSHADASILQKLGESARNLAHHVAPEVTAWMRTRGLGGKDARRFPTLAEYPPSWMSARDHFLFLGRREYRLR